MVPDVDDEARVAPARAATHALRFEHDDAPGGPVHCKLSCCREAGEPGAEHDAIRMLLPYQPARRCERRQPGAPAAALIVIW